MKRFFLLMIMGILILGSSCNPTKDRNVPPPQSDLDAVIQLLVADVEEISQKLAMATNCEEFNQGVANIPETFNCVKGGSLSVTVESSDCMNGPPLTANLNVLLVSRSCTVEGKASSGQLTTQFSIQGDQEMALLMGQDLVIAGIKFNFTNFEIILENGQAVSCSGTMRIFETLQCTVAADCSGCPLDS